MAADLVHRNVAVILAGGGIPVVRAAIASTQTIPIVFTTNTDPVATGLVASINRPGGNVTGVTGIGSELYPKRLELLHEFIPTATRFAILTNPTDPATMKDEIEAAEIAARRFELQIVYLEASTEKEIEQAFAGAVQQGAAALMANDAYLTSQREQFAALSLRYSLPVSSGTRDSVEAGMLMSYGADANDTYRQAGVYVGRILKGEKPANLPVMQPSKFELVINLKTAKALGLTVPPALLVAADEVIE